MRRFLLIAIRVYQLTLSPLLGRSCRFLPTCSCYTAEAIGRFGAGHGSWLGLKRIARCHPWRDGGYDPVPVSDSARATEMARGVPRG